MAQSELSALQIGVKAAISLVICFTFAITVTLIGYIYTNNQATAIKNEAIDACMTAAQSTWNTTMQEADEKQVNNTVVEPNTQWYQTCLTQKGIEVIK